MAAVAKDPAIKLFGRTISLPDIHFSEDSESLENGSSMTTKAETGECRNENCRTVDEAASVQRCKVEQTQASFQQPSQAMLKPKGHQDESDSTEELKSYKRPDKIVSCPRCNSLDTKFCYFNNYNVNQPRHFCKSCQRYWTAGGTVRNVPVGAGRRRNKQLASQYRQIVPSSDGGPITVVETVDSAIQLLSCEQSASSCTVSSSNEMVLKFGPESPHCDSTQNIARQSQGNGCSRMDVHNGEIYDTGSLPCAPLTVSSSELRGINSDLSLQQPLYHCTLPPPITAVVPDSNGSVPLALPGCASSNISLQFVPASYFNCIPIWVAGSGNISLAVQNGSVPSQFLSNVSGLQVLGKHPRDVNSPEDTGMNTSQSKSHRICDLDEA